MEWVLGGTRIAWNATPEEFRRHVGRIAPGVAFHVTRPGDDLAS